MLGAPLPLTSQAVWDSCFKHCLVISPKQRGQVTRAGNSKTGSNQLFLFLSWFSSLACYKNRKLAGMKFMSHRFLNCDKICLMCSTPCSCGTQSKESTQKQRPCCGMVSDNKILCLWPEHLISHLTHLQNLLISQFSADMKLGEIRFQEHNKLHIIVNSTHDFQDFATESNIYIT